MDFFTADAHFGHVNILHYCDRPFASVEEMDAALIARWNRRVRPRGVAIAVIRYRSEHKLSQRALATQLGMPASQVARLELGEHNPSIETLQRLAKGLGRRFIVAVAPDQVTELTLPKGVEILADVLLEDGSRVLAAAG